MRKNTDLGMRLAAAVFTVCMILAVLPFIMPGRSSVYAAAVKSAAQAKSIALKDAGLKETNVTFIKAKHEIDDDDEWEVEFKSGGYKYDYSILSKNGKIKEKEYEIIKVKKSAGTKQITQSKAKQFALKNAKQTSTSVKKLKIKKKTFRSKAKVWEVSFKKGKNEWEYKIDRYSGKILEMEYSYDD